MNNVFPIKFPHTHSTDLWDKGFCVVVSVSNGNIWSQSDQKCHIMFP